MNLSQFCIEECSSANIAVEHDFTQTYVDASRLDLEPLSVFSPTCMESLRDVSSYVFESPEEEETDVLLEPRPFAKDDCPWMIMMRGATFTINEEKNLDTPSRYDVVCSRVKQFYELPGCQRFRQIVRAAIPAYMRASTRVDKSLVIASTIDMVKHHPKVGRIHFWKYQSNGSWVALGSDQIRDKVGHALREMMQEVKRAQRKQTTRQRAF